MVCLRDKQLEDKWREMVITKHDRSTSQQASRSKFAHLNSSEVQPPTSSDYTHTQREVIDSFIKHRDGGYTSWKFKKHPILNRNKTYYRYVCNLSENFVRVNLIYRIICAFYYSFTLSLSLSLPFLHQRYLSGTKDTSISTKFTQ